MYLILNSAHLMGDSDKSINVTTQLSEAPCTSDTVVPASTTGISDKDTLTITLERSTPDAASANTPASNHTLNTDPTADDSILNPNLTVSNTIMSSHVEATALPDRLGNLDAQASIQMVNARLVFHDLNMTHHNHRQLMICLPRNYLQQKESIH